MRMQADDARRDRVGGGDELGQTIQRQTELGALAAGANLFMMAVAETRIDAQHDRAAAKQLGPAVQDFHAIDGDENPARQRLHVVLARRSEAHTSELQSLMRISYAVFCLQT